MELTEKCIVCGQTGAARDLGVWIVGNARWPIHVACWITAYDADRLHTAAKAAER
jgi:hypothetical protein